MNYLMQKKYFKQFLKFVNEYNKYIPKTIEIKGWTTGHVKHINQNDSNNCGVYIIYFFQQIVKGRSLLENEDPQKYRNYLMRLFLEKSDCMADFCIVCGNTKYRKPTVYCKMCSRVAHIDKSCENQKNYVDEICSFCMKYSFSCYVP